MQIILHFIFNIFLNLQGQRIAKKKTHVKKRTLSPVFNESFAFDIPITEGGGQTLDGVSLELLLLDWDRVTKNEVGSNISICDFETIYILLLGNWEIRVRTK